MVQVNLQLSNAWLSMNSLVRETSRLMDGISRNSTLSQSWWGIKLVTALRLTQSHLNWRSKRLLNSLQDSKVLMIQLLSSLLSYGLRNLRFSNSLILMQLNLVEVTKENFALHRPCLPIRPSFFLMSLQQVLILIPEGDFGRPLETKARTQLWLLLPIQWKRLRLLVPRLQFKLTEDSNALVQLSKSRQTMDKVLPLCLRLTWRLLMRELKSLQTKTSTIENHMPWYKCQLIKLIRKQEISWLLIRSKRELPNGLWVKCLKLQEVLKLMILLS